MNRPREGPVEREDLEVVRRRPIGRRRYHRPTVAGITAHDAWICWIVEARPTRLDQLIRREALSTRRCPRHERKSERHDKKRKPAHPVPLPQRCRPEGPIIKPPKN